MTDSITDPVGAAAGPARIGRPGLAHDLVQVLTAQLDSGAIKPGDKLPTEAALMQSAGVSRGVVREALSRLTASGRVQTHHGIGTFALEPRGEGRFQMAHPVVADLPEMLDLLELRTSVESDAAGLAAARRTEAQLHAMRRALDDFGNHLDTVGETVAPDFRFHLAIAQATGNRYYSDLMVQLGLAVIPTTRRSSVRLDAGYREKHLQKVHQEHQDIFFAIARREPEAARAAMRIHLVNSRERQRQSHALAAADPMHPELPPHAQ